jgi:LuxR family transcriptional regulator, maltose regulon positive regulatory protein
MADLALTVAETADLVRRHDVSLTRQQIEDVWRRIESWPAGLRLAAQRLRAQPNTVQAIDEVNGREPAVADHLLNEVLDRQPAETQDTLLRGSIPDRLCGDLVDALTGGSDGAQVLADLEWTDAFMSSRKPRPTPYRFHRMFGDILRAELQRRHPKSVVDLHRREAGWCAAHNLPREALGHALRCGDLRHAADVLVAHWPELAVAGHDTMPTLRIPEPAAASLTRDPEIILAYAAHAPNQRDLATAAAYVRVSQQCPSSAGHRSSRPHALITASLRLAQARLAGDTAGAYAEASQILARVRAIDWRTGDPALADAAASIALTALGSAALDRGDLNDAEEGLCGGLAAAERAGLSCLRLICTSRLALMRAERGSSPRGAPRPHGPRHGAVRRAGSHRAPRIRLPRARSRQPPPGPAR